MKAYIVHDDGSWSELADANFVGIAVVLSDADKRNVAGMAPDAVLYCSFPDDFNRDAVKRALDDIRQNLTDVEVGHRGMGEGGRT